MQWVYLLIAGFFEITWAVALKLSRGFSLGLPSVVTLVGMVFSYVFLGMAMRNLPLGVAYAVWTGIGIMGSFVFGVCVLHESPRKVCSRNFFVDFLLHKVNRILSR